MAKYTTELRSICETYAGYSEQQGLGNTSAVIQAALPKLFDFDFPIYDENYRNVLETKIVRHFYTREIGAETVGRWKLFLEDRLNMIMPYYNKLYQSELIEFNPMYDVDLTTDHSKGNEGNAESQQNRTDNIERNRAYGRKDDYTRDLAETNSYTRDLKETDEYTRDLKESDEYTRNLKETDAYNRDLKETNDLTRNLANSNLETRDLADHSSDVKNQTHIDKYSDTPQGAITGLENDNYLTNARIITDNSTDEVSETHTGTVNNDGTETGTSNTTINQTGTDNRSIAQTGTDSRAIGQTGTDSRTIGQTGTDNRSIAQTGTNSRTIADTDDISTAQTGNTNGTSKYTDTESYLEHVKGKTSGPSYSKLLQEYRDTFINIDNMIIGQLNDLFINLW